MCDWQNREPGQMVTYENIKRGNESLAVIGLGYVGLPIAVEFARRGVSVIGFDLNDMKIAQYQAGRDPTKEVGDENVRSSSVQFTADAAMLEKARFHIVAVPTPVHKDHTPDLRPIESASHTVGQHLTSGSVVVFESTVYPGVTEEVCIPILEQESGMVCGVDFKVGYSPERINPGDKQHRLSSIQKIVSGMDAETLDLIAQVYTLIIDAGVFKAESIKVAEAAKVIENSQRDINIAFMNELAIIFHKLGIDTQAVLAAAGTKWNFLKFQPGLVGGHCIGVDPYYLTYRAEELGYRSQVILAGRRINDDMGKYVVRHLVKKMIAADIPIRGATVGVLGFTFKENCPDTRNTKVIDIIEELHDYGIQTIITDPCADYVEAMHLYGLKLCTMREIHDCDAVVVAVAHREFMDLQRSDIDGLYKALPARKKVLADVKGLFDRKEYEQAGYVYWRL